MLVELVTKSNNQYILTDDGEITAYTITMRNLIKHYLLNGLKLPNAEIKNRLIAFNNFAKTKLISTDSFLENIDHISEQIGAESKFVAFIGQHFLAQCDKIKNELMARELPKAKDRYDNPYRCPGNTFLDNYETIFLKSANTTSLANQSSTIETNSTAIKQEVKGKGSATTTPALPSLMPGEEFLKISESVFNASPEFSSKTALATKTTTTSTPNESITTASKTDSVAKLKMPGEYLLERLSNNFSNAPVTSYKGQENNSEIKQIQINLNTQLSFKEFAQINSSLSKHSASGDNNAYQKWFSSLKVLYKTAITLNNLVSKEKKGVQIVWENQINNLCLKLSLKKEVVNKILAEINAYRIVLTSLQQEIKKASAQSSNANSIRALYPQLVNIFENKGTIHSKETNLQMVLLQITEPEIKSMLKDDLLNLITKLKDLYNLE